MGQLDMRFNDAVEALQGLPSELVKIVVDDANASRNSTVWPAPFRASEEEITSAVDALNQAATTSAQRDAIKFVASAAAESRSMNNDRKRTFA